MSQLGLICNSPFTMVERVGEVSRLSTTKKLGHTGRQTDTGKYRDALHLKRNKKSRSYSKGSHIYISIVIFAEIEPSI